VPGEVTREPADTGPVGGALGQEPRAFGGAALVEQRVRDGVDRGRVLWPQAQRA
jgi:hypothetical protein